jgi:hypothetical protein
MCRKRVLYAMHESIVDGYRVLANCSNRAVYVVGVDNLLSYVHHRDT